MRWGDGRHGGRKTRATISMMGLASVMQNANVRSAQSWPHHAGPDRRVPTVSSCLHCLNTPFRDAWPLVTMLIVLARISELADNSLASFFIGRDRRGEVAASERSAQAHPDRVREEGQRF